MGYRIKRFSIEDTSDIDKLKENIISVLATKQVTGLSKNILEKYNIPSLEELSSLTKKRKDKDDYIEKRTSEKFSYEDFPEIRKNNIIIRKPEIKYHREDINKTPNTIQRSIIKYPEDNEDDLE